MNVRGVEKARVRFKVAENALLGIEASSTFSEFEASWVTFLAALHTIHAVLEQSAKGSSASERWYRDKKVERKIDPLLQYIHQARHADEHGIEPIAEHVPGGFFIGAAGESVHIENLQFDERGNASFRALPIEGKLPTVGIIAPHARLVPVRNRGVLYHPPSEHLGRPLEHGSPLEVARQALSYHRKLVEEGGELVTS